MWTSKVPIPAYEQYPAWGKGDQVREPCEWVSRSKLSVWMKSMQADLRSPHVSAASLPLRAQSYDSPLGQLEVNTATGRYDIPSEPCGVADGGSIMSQTLKAAILDEDVNSA